MENINTVASFFLNKESMTQKKLQKLCYYSQAWYLANYGEPLFPDHFEAWIHGPVCPRLYYIYRDWGWINIPQQYLCSVIDNEKVRILLEKVYETYGAYSGDELETLTHSEEPWINARRGYSPTEYSRVIIPFDEMKKYYGEKIGIQWNT